MKKYSSQPELEPFLRNRYLNPIKTHGEIRNYKDVEEDCILCALTHDRRWDERGEALQRVSLQRVQDS